jgi:response regulator RpfG family c-di-GMP phosphodiesterase
MILEGRGTDFDPAIVDAFMSIKSEIMGINRMLTDQNVDTLLQTAHHASPL